MLNVRSFLLVSATALSIGGAASARAWQPIQQTMTGGGQGPYVNHEPGLQSDILGNSIAPTAIGGALGGLAAGAGGAVAGAARGAVRSIGMGTVSVYGKSTK